MLKSARRSILSGSSKIGRILLLSGVVLGFAAAAAVLALRYWVLPDIEKYHNEVTQMASRAVGLPVTIGRIEAGWQGLRPHLMLNDVRLLDKQGNSALVLRRVDNVVSWMTLVYGELRLHALEVDDPDLVIRRDKQGHLHVAGLQLAETSGDSKLSDWLLHQSSIIVRDGRITWQDELYDRPALVLSQVQFRLNNGARHHHFALRLAPPDTVSTPLDVRGDLVGKSFSDWGDWHGELYTQLEFTDIRNWAAWLDLPEQLSHGRGGLRAWLGIEAGQLKRVTADVDLQAVQSRLGAGLPELNLTTLHGRVAARWLERGFEISTKRLALRMPDGFVLQPTDFHLHLSGKPQMPFASGELEANFIELADLAALAEYIPLGQEFKQKLADFAPRGHIADLSVQWNGDEEKRARFDVKAHFDNISLRRVGVFPGVENLSGQVDGSDNSGSLVVNAPRLKLDAPQLLLEPLTFDTFAAQASWQRKPGGWDVKLNDFSAANEDMAGTAYGNYQTAEQGLGVADVTLNLSRASMRHAVRYLPKELLGNATMTWLQSALLGGEADNVHMRLRGDLDDFPFPENKQGLFRVEAKASGLVIDYVKGWPRVEDTSATFSIEGSHLQVDSTSTLLAGGRAQKVNVSIPDFTAASPVVKIRGELSGETQHALDFIKHSPVRGYINGFTDNATARGVGKLDMQLDIPLGDQPTKLNGNYHFADNDISLDEHIPMGRRVTGDMQFTEASLLVKDLHAQLLGGPATLSVQTLSGGALKATLQGRANLDVWRKLNPEPLLQPLSGYAEWSSEVSVSGGQYTVVATSNLQGLDSDLPAPLTKRANEVIPIKFELRSSSASQDVMWLQYDNLISARMLRADNKLGVRTIKRGYVNFGSPRRMLDRDGIWVAGTLPVLSLEGWNRVWPSEASETGPQIDGIDISVQKLLGYGSTVNGVNVHARNRNGLFSAQLAAKDLNGELSWFPQGKGKLVMRLKNAVLAETEKDKAAEAAHGAVPALVANQTGSSVSIPVFDVAVENFTYHGKPLGRMELHASQFEKDILLDHFKLANPDGVMLANGKWGMSPAQSHLVVKLELNDVGNVLARYGYPNSVRNGSGSLDCDLTWAGAPEDFALTNLDGHMNLKMAKGQFLKLDPGAGKLLSVLSLQSLPKRITLDFNDVFSQGFEFDSMEGVAQIRQGVLATNDYKINGSAAAVNLSGQVDLARETQNLRVRVMPTIGDSVSLLAFAAGPAVGAGVYLANKILRDPLDKLVSFEYNVTGSWVDPKVEKVGQVKAAPQ